MATRMKRGRSLRPSKLKSVLQPILRTSDPSVIMGLISQTYHTFWRLSGNSAEKYYWEKCFKSTRNLSHGMGKWMEEWIEEEREDRYAGR